MAGGPEVLTADRIKPLLLHEDRTIRAAAAQYVGDGWARDPDLVPMTLEAWARYGDEGGLRGLSVCPRFVLTEPALDQVLGRLAGTRHAEAIEHLNRVIAHAPGELMRAEVQEVLRARRMRRAQGRAPLPHLTF
jgi:hypothetical protein